MGFLFAVIVIFLLLAANFQSLRLPLIVVSTVPAVIAGVVLALWITRTTLNIQSYMGAIMAVGVAVANAILLVTFAERSRMEGSTAADAAVEGARSRLRPILMTSLAMIAGMVPMAMGLGEGGQPTGAARPRGHRRPGGGDHRDAARSAVDIRRQSSPAPQPAPHPSILPIPKA